MNPSNAPTSRHASFLARCLFIDLEVGVQDRVIHRFAAVRGDTGDPFEFNNGSLSITLRSLDDFAEGLDFLVGHNLIAFDMMHLAAAAPRLAVLALPPIDTLRLNPLAFPKHPYHHLVKHYQDGGLQRGRLNDPEHDARLAMQLLGEQYDALTQCASDAPFLVSAFHWLTSQGAHPVGFDSIFSAIRGANRPDDADGMAAIEQQLATETCRTQCRAIRAQAQTHSWALAYALAWLSVPNSNSALSPWVRHEFPDTGILLKALRDTACLSPECVWCLEQHDAHKALKRWFGHDSFRPQPADTAGHSLQQSIVEAAVRGEHVLGILPTGTGKSLCYQLPALSRYEKTGSLTVVVSPLVALMADQVTALHNRGLTQAAAINGLLSMPERTDVLDRVRLGEIGILLLSPEQLRNRSVRRALAQRELGGWVLDEAHCLSKWGHDFRPDYRYVGRFIKDSAGEQSIPQILALTATARPEVKQELVDYFETKLGLALVVIDGGSTRTNLTFAVVPTSPLEKLPQVYRVLQQRMPPEVPGGAIVYCATRHFTEELAAYLREKGLQARHFHAGMTPEDKKSVQQSFIAGELRVIVATNAFGMGIDKPDVRLVVHADIPGSLENYLQEAGRAGRDSDKAACVLLYCEDDVDRQFNISARSRLTQQDIQGILKALRRLDRKKRTGGEVIATPSEVLVEDSDASFIRDSATDDTRVKTAVSWLEEAALLSREENFVQVFPSSLRVRTMDDARERLALARITDVRRAELLKLIDALMTADVDEGISTDELQGRCELSSDELRAALSDLQRLGIASNDMALTAFVHKDVPGASSGRLQAIVEREKRLLDLLQLLAPDLSSGQGALLHLRIAATKLTSTFPDGNGVLPKDIRRLIAGIAGDGRHDGTGRGSLAVKRVDDEMVRLTLQREWPEVTELAKRRHAAASLALKHLLDLVPEGAAGTDLLVSSTMGQLLAAIETDLILSAEGTDTRRLTEQALLWLHEQRVIQLNKGLAVFRTAMTIELAQDRRGFMRADFGPLEEHYNGQIEQIHVMAEYAELGLGKMADAFQLSLDYFHLPHAAFVRRWLGGRAKELQRQTTPRSWARIVESLNDRNQKAIVADDRDRTNVLVLAGPGSGKTRVLVHRIAYLVRVRRENPRGIIALAYNRHAAVQIRQRLADLIGPDARGVQVLTCHALAMRIAGMSFADVAGQVDQRAFKRVLERATALLRGEGCLPEEADEQRDQLLAGFRWILVDEYQDIGREEYDLISALAGRTHQDAAARLSLFAVGDDDQNIYAFDGKSVEFIRRFESDYGATPAYLTQNYRSTAHIINAANAVIAPAERRMKSGRPIEINRARRTMPAGGAWQGFDTVGRGRVQIVDAHSDPMKQALAVMGELERLAAIGGVSWNWSRVAVLARKWRALDPVRGYCELHGIPVQMADEEAPHTWRLRESQALIDWIHHQKSKLVEGAAMLEWLDRQTVGPWWSLLKEAVEAYSLETTGEAMPADHFRAWLAEWGREARQRQRGLLLSSCHRAKGLEFDHVAVLDEDWARIDKGEETDSARRLYYVAMTRAKETLTLAQLRGKSGFTSDLAVMDCFQRRPGVELSPTPPELSRRYVRLTLRDVDIGFAGRKDPTDSIHGAISALVPGSTLQLVPTGARMELVTADGYVVGKLARSWKPPVETPCIQATVSSVIVRFRRDEAGGFEKLLQCDRWEVVLAELVYQT